MRHPSVLFCRSDELVVPLKGRFSDSNKAVQTLALDVLGRIATGMNKPFETHARTFIPPVTTVLADAKAPIRASASAALTAMAEQIGISPMIGGFSTVLESKVANPTLRQDLFTWLAAWFEQNPPAAPLDLAPLALPVVQCLDDKAAPVRKAAQAVLPFIITRAGYKHVMEQTNSLKAASRNSVIPMIDTAKALAAPPAPAKAAPAKVGAAKPAPVKTAAAAAHARSDSPGPGSPKPSGLARAPSVKPPSAVGRSLKAPSSMSRPTSRLDTEDPAEPSSGLAGPGFKSRLAGIKAPAPSASAAAGPSSSALADKSAPFLSADPKFKQMREKKEGRGQHWIGNEGAPRPELSDALRQQCENHCSHGLIDSMFSKDHNAERDYLSALTLLSDFISSPTFAEEEYGLSQEETVGRVVANTDLVLKYVAIRLTDNNTSISLKCLDILDNLADLLRAEMYHMTDYEANSLFPCLIAKVCPVLSPNQSPLPT